MSLTIVLSGPKTSESQVRTALAAEGFDPHPTDHDHGLPATASGKMLRQAQSFVTVEGDDIDMATGAVRSLGWTLRMHHETPEALPPSPEQQLADKLAAVEQRLAALEG